MSDLLIKNMEMPKDGQKMYMITFSDGKACASHKPFEWHEVIPVPPHGRLIDADALTYLMGMDEHYSPLEALYLMGLIADAPTIIPAEEEA